MMMTELKVKTRFPYMIFLHSWWMTTDAVVVKDFACFGLLSKKGAFVGSIWQNFQTWRLENYAENGGHLSLAALDVRISKAS